MHYELGMLLYVHNSGSTAMNSTHAQSEGTTRTEIKSTEKGDITNKQNNSQHGPVATAVYDVHQDVVTATSRTETGDVDSLDLNFEASFSIPIIPGALSIGVSFGAG
uniref:Uncharacterized protein n=1 Tax=Ditylenchus dipsaci TaxID=166011 RepID=A0A915CLD0_9BILA